MPPLDILVVAPHPDDAEISVGGTIATSIQQKLRVGVVELTSGEPTPHGSIETRRHETQKSTEILGLTWQDAHPDHVAASSLCDDARFWSKLSRSDMQGEPFWPPLLLHYFSIHLRIHPTPSIVMDISSQIETKLAAVSAFESQMITGRSQEFPTVIDDIRDRARYWGWSIGRAFGEPLTNRESTGIASLTSLLR